MYPYVLSSMQWCLLRFPHKTTFGSSLPPVVCWREHVLFALFVFACAQWCITYILLCFSSNCVHFVASFSRLSLRYSPMFIYYLKNTTQKTKEEYEDTKVVIRICISKKNRQQNCQKKKYKRTNKDNDLQNIHIKLKIAQHEPH